MITCFHLKNIVVHSKLRTNCAIKKPNGLHKPLHFLLFETNTNEIAINIYKIVQTTPKVQSGGLRGDLLSESYQSLLYIIYNI